jgi:hypothetical protein
MSVESGEWVVYHPPKSVSFGHQSRMRDPRRAWPTVERFMADLTLFTLGDRMELTCHDPSARTDGDVAAARIREARRCFGPEIPPQGRYKTHPRWKIGESQLESAIQFALDDDRFPKQELGPSWFSFNYEFRWKEFDVPRVVPSGAEPRNCVSHLGVTIGQQRLFLQPSFIYPASCNSESLKDFIDRSELIAPFRFRDQYFNRWLPPQSPASKHGRYLRLEPTWRRGSVLH